MKKTIITMIAITMTLALCACGAETTGSMSITETGTEQTVKQNINTEQTNSEDSNTEKQNTAEATTTSETSKAQQSQAKKEAYTELDKVLDEINTEIKPGTAGSGMNSIKVAAHLLNWGVGTSMTADEIKKETINWLSDKGNSDQVEFSNKLALVYESYNKLLGSDAKQLLESAGCTDAAYPWSDSPVETIEAIVEVVQLPEDSTDTSSDIDPSWKDVAELVNLKGDETTVYLLADGRYMDRTDTVYIYDGVDTWTDESGVEWNEVVK